MTKTKKCSRFFAVALAIVLVMAVAVPSFAAWNEDGWTHAATPWNSATYNGSIQVLAEAGRGGKLFTKSINTGATPFWQMRDARHGQGYTLRTGSNPDADCVNIYWSKEYGSVYYPATLFYYEGATNGADQRLLVANYADGTRFKLEQPTYGSEWYLQTDKSAPSDFSEVIWYTVNSGPRARWGCVL